MPAVPPGRTGRLEVLKPRSGAKSGGNWEKHMEKADVFDVFGGDCVIIRGGWPHFLLVETRIT